MLWGVNCIVACAEASIKCMVGSVNSSYMVCAILSRRAQGTSPTTRYRMASLWAYGKSYMRCPRKDRTGPG